MPTRRLQWPGLDLGLHCILSSGLAGALLNCFPYSTQSWGGGRRGVGVNPSLFKFQLGLLWESSWLVLGPNLATLFIGSQSRDWRVKRCRR
uniref:Unnamed protein product n=1 Tax=Macaca fascicularis TaxID=9541 RepID=Q9N036_MACFA|nr:unnamed protein product [Macaca fascicularis]